jgi:Protein of unknown function (DUF2934)
MKDYSDHDGKAKAASGVDGGHHPKQHNGHDQPDSGALNTGEIAELAYHLWRQRGCPEGSADQDWFEAMEQLREKTNSTAARSASPASGSVQR